MKYGIQRCEAASWMELPKEQAGGMRLDVSRSWRAARSWLGFVAFVLMFVLALGCMAAAVLGWEGFGA